MDATILENVKIDKARKQRDAGQKLAQFCVHVGRCPICTLVPPCNHYSQFDVSSRSQNSNQVPNDENLKNAV